MANYDCLEPEDELFGSHVEKFKAKIENLEQRLSLVVGESLKKAQIPDIFFKVNQAPPYPGFATNHSDNHTTNY